MSRAADLLKRAAPWLGAFVLLAVLLGLALAFAGGSEDSAASAEDLGDFVVKPAALKTDAFTDLAAQLSRDKALEDIADTLNASLILPQDIAMRFEECDEDNAWYDPETRMISICLEMFDAARTAMHEQVDAEDLDDAVDGAFLFTVFHEVGHALIDAFDLPITGREEDAADQLSAWWLIDHDTGDQAAIDGALSFYADAQGTELDESDFADEHALSQQRFYNLTCWVYGSDPARHADLLTDAWLTQARAEQCEAEYETLNTSWQSLLNDHLKE